MDEYLARVRRYAACDEIEVRDEERTAAAAFERALPARAKVVALEVDGQPLSSERFAAYLGRLRDQGAGPVAFVIGGAFGLPPALSASADLRLSLGPMTLPHRLARLVLAEQLYRAFTILAGEPYHHAG